MPSTDDRKIDREHEHRGPHRPGARHEILGVAAVAHHVQLEPRRRRHRPGDLLDATDRDRRLDERHPGRLGGASRLDLRPTGEHPAEADRREDDRQRELLAEHLDRRVTVIAVAAVQGFLCGLGAWITGLPSPVLWGVAAAVVSVLPLFGSALVWLPGAAVLFAQGSIGRRCVLLSGAQGWWVPSIISFAPGW